MCLRRPRLFPSCRRRRRHGCRRHPWASCLWWRASTLLLRSSRSLLLRMSSSLSRRRDSRALRRARRARARRPRPTRRSAPSNRGLRQGGCGRRRHSSDTTPGWSAAAPRREDMLHRRLPPRGVRPMPHLLETATSRRSRARHGRTDDFGWPIGGGRARGACGRRRRRNRLSRRAGRARIWLGRRRRLGRSGRGQGRRRAGARGRRLRNRGWPSGAWRRRGTRKRCGRHRRRDGRWLRCCGRLRCGAGYRKIGVAAHRHPAARTEAVFAAVDRGAPGTCCDTGLAQDCYRSALAERSFDRAQLGVDLIERCQLREYERVVALSEPVQVEDQAAEVAVGELARLAQEARATARPTARLEAGRLGCRPAGAARTIRGCLGLVVLCLRRRVRGGRSSLLHVSIHATQTVSGPRKQPSSRQSPRARSHGACPRR